MNELQSRPVVVMNFSGIYRWEPFALDKRLTYRLVQISVVLTGIARGRRLRRLLSVFQSLGLKAFILSTMAITTMSRNYGQT